MNRLSRALAIGMVGTLLAQSHVFADSSADLEQLDTQLALVEEFVSGTFDNYEQVYWEQVRKVPENLRHRRITATYLKVVLPKFGNHVVYADKYWDGDPDKRAYRNLYVFSADRNLNGLRMNLLGIPRPDRFDNALRDPSELLVLDPSEMSAMDSSCNTVWRLRGTVFTTSFAGSCTLGKNGKEHGFTVPTHLTSDSTIGRGHFIYLTTGVDDRGKLVSGPPDFVPSAELRARKFNCSVSHTTGSTETVHIHDRGGVASLSATGSVPAVSIRLRQFTPPGTIESTGLALIVLPPDGQEKVDAQFQLTTPHAIAPRDANQIAFKDESVRIRCLLLNEAPPWREASATQTKLEDQHTFNEMAWTSSARVNQGG